MAEIFSGISPTPNFVITVSSTSPQFFYCPVDGHCQGGMVFAINPSVLSFLLLVLTSREA